MTPAAYDGPDCAVMVGKFDGLHLGHRVLLEKMSLNCGALSKAILSIVTETKESKEILSFSEKQSLCEELGFDAYVNLTFTEQVRNTDAVTFVREILIGQLKAKQIYVGEGFRFGKDRSGDTELLEKEAAKYGAKVTVVPAEKADGKPVSSTEIRRRITEGATDKVTELLGQSYYICGNTREGRKLGRVMHFPTLNLAPPSEKLLPPFGVYRTFTEYEGIVYPSVTNVGVNPSVKDDGRVSVETHLLKTPAESVPYGAFIKVSFAERIRPERKFASVEELSEQIRMDKETVEKMNRKQ